MEQRLHTFRGATLNEAYQAMRKELGAHAVVVRTAEVRARGLRGVLGAKAIEVTAAQRRDGQDPARERGRAALWGVGPQTRGGATGDASAHERARAEKTTRETPGALCVAAPNTDSLRKELRELRRMVEMLAVDHPGIGLPRECYPHYRRLLNGGMPRPMASSLLSAIAQENEAGLLRDPSIFRQCLRREIRRRSMVTGGIALTPGQCHTVALIGSTGVGKTTNLAKLAARYALHEQANVALVTLDTYRVAAPDQLRVFANIMGLSVHVVNDAEEARKVKRERCRTTTLYSSIPQAGARSIVNRSPICATTLSPFAADEVIHVVAANTPHDDLQHALRAFRLLNPTALMLTKLDETRLHGGLYAAISEARLPLSYFSTGQNVPDDILLAQPDTIADFIIQSGEAAA
jgi:flagellar biosynthesis protein FlhF